jgi:hypothetical protein
MPKPVRPFHGPLGSIAYRSKGTARRDARYARCFPRSLAKPRANWSCRRATANAGRQRDRRLDAQPLRSAETRQICPFSRLPRGIVAHGGRGFLNNAPRRPATDRPQRVQSREIRTGVGWPGANQHPSFSTGYRWRLGEFPAARIGKSTGFGRKCQIQLLERLYRPFPVDRRGEVPEGKGPFYEAPVFSEHAGYVSVLYSRLHIGSAQRFPEARRLTAEDIEALDMLGELAGDPELRST